MKQSFSKLIKLFLISFVFISLPFLLFNCNTKKITIHTPETALFSLSSNKYPFFSDDINFDGLSSSIQNSLTYLKRLPQNRSLTFGIDMYEVNHLIISLETFKDFIKNRPDTKKLNKYIRSNYKVYQSAGSNDLHKVLFTGYYEPVLNGSLNKTSRYKYPIHTYPNDLLQIKLSSFSDKYKGEKIVGRYENKTVVPYYERSEIDNNDLFFHKSKPLAYVDDPIDLFFLHIQGSGKINLNDGNTINVHYHAANGRPYKSIGSLLIKKNKIPKSEMSMQRIYTYLKNHPDEMQDIFNYNPSYVFFKKEKGGPIGCYGFPVTAGRSIATDRKFFPAAALAFIKTQKPLIDGDGVIHKWTNFSRFVLNQDTGGAIKGPGRTDIFWGNGLHMLFLEKFQWFLHNYRIFPKPLLLVVLC